MQRLLAVIIVLGGVALGVFYVGAVTASASSWWYGTLRGGSAVVRFLPNNDPGTLVRTVRVAVMWETDARLVGQLWCGSGNSINTLMARSYGHDAFLSLTAGVPNFYPRCEIWLSRHSGPTTRFVMNIFGRQARAGSYLLPADEAIRRLELDEEIERIQLLESTFTGAVDDLEEPDR